MALQLLYKTKPLTVEGFLVSCSWHSGNLPTNSPNANHPGTFSGALLLMALRQSPSKPFQMLIIQFSLAMGLIGVTDKNRTALHFIS